MLTIDDLNPLPPFSTDALNHSCYQRYLRYYQLNFLEQETCIEQAFGGMHLGDFHIAVHHLQIAQPKGTVLLIHGYLDHSGMQQKLVDFFLAQSLNVLLFDLPGHGLSSGDRAGIDSFDDYQRVLEPLVDYMKAQCPMPHFMVGHSTGGSIAMHYIQNHQYHSFDKVILLAPLVEPYQWLLLKHQCLLLKPFLAKVKRRFNQNTSDLQAWHFMEYQDPLQARFIKMSWLAALAQWITIYTQAEVAQTRVLMIQGDKDQTVNWKKNRRLINDKFEQLTYKEIAGARHHLINEALDYRSEAFAAIKIFID